LHKIEKLIFLIVKTSIVLHTLKLALKVAAVLLDARKLLMPSGVEGHECNAISGKGKL
jgi:hypothetical protein